MSAVLYALPALGLLVALLLGRYPGERLILAAAGRARLRPRPAARTAPGLASLDRGAVPRGGDLLALALAGRAPPHGRRNPRPSIPKHKEQQMRRIAIPLVAVLAAVVVPAAASAHVSLHPNEVPTGAYATLDLRVPNEMESADTVKIAVQLPQGFTDVSPEYLPGWTPKIRKVKLAKPVQSDDGPITEGVREIVWEGKGADGRIPPGQFLNFPISTEIPGKAGTTITFKVLQYYDDGEVVRWIGPPSSDEPAPDIDVTAAGGPLQDVAGSEADAPKPGESAAGGASGTTSGGEANTEGSASSAGDSSSASGSSSGGSSDKGLAIAALVVAVISLLVAATAVIGTRRRTA